MNFDLKEIFTAFMVLFAVIDIVGNIPIIIDLRKKAGHIQSEKASVIAGVIMIIFLFVGESILKLVGIDVASKVYSLSKVAPSSSFINYIIKQGMCHQH